MKIAVLSGKGGTGKTFVSTNLAAVIKGAVYIDCDVEEPNGRLFLACDSNEKEDVFVLLPKFNSQRCIGCRLCVDFCQFNAIAFIGKMPRVFKEVCHSCGGCKLLCTNSAVEEEPVPIGKIETGVSHGVTVISGEMNIGESSGVPIIRKALAKAESLASPLTVIDCPPGSACSVTDSIREADYCLMVAEPTVFGLHDLQMVIELVKTVDKPCGVLLNKCDSAFFEIEETCRKNSIPIIAKIPYKKEFASCISSGNLLVDESEEARGIFISLAKQMGVES